MKCARCQTEMKSVKKWNFGNDIENEKFECPKCGVSCVARISIQWFDENGKNSPYMNGVFGVKDPNHDATLSYQELLAKRLGANLS